MTRAAVQATEAADSLRAWLERQHRPASSPEGPALSIGSTNGRRRSAPPAARPEPENPIVPPDSPVIDAALILPHPDWLHHRLSVTGPADQLAEFRQAAAGPGTIPWHLDLDRMEEDFFHLLAAPPPPQQRTLSVAGCRVLAGQLRAAVAQRHALAVARRGSRACPLDLHALIPVPDALLQRGPDDPESLAWLWTHWGTTQLRQVAEDTRSEAAFRLTFWAADWTPWRALATLRARWPALHFAIRPTYPCPASP